MIRPMICTMLGLRQNVYNVYTFHFSKTGTADALGTELLECLLKMAPTNEEERKLREYRDESPLKLGPAEKFLKAVLDHVPFAFKRVDAMLYIATFESEVEYLRKSFETLEVRLLRAMFRKLFTFPLYP